METAATSQVAKVGMGERFAAASRPGPSQQAAEGRALELCGTQPSACPRAPTSPAHPKAGRPQGEGLHQLSSYSLLEDPNKAD